MSKEKPKKKRTAPLSFRVPKSRITEFHLRWERSGKSLSAFVVDCCLDGEAPRQARRASVEAQQLAREVALLAGIKDELGRIQEEAGTSDALEAQLEKIYAVLVELRARAFQAMGRKS